VTATGRAHRADRALAHIKEITMTTPVTPPSDPVQPDPEGQDPALPDPASSGRKRRTILQWVLAAAATAVALAAVLRVAPTVFALPVIGVLLAGIARPVSDPAARHLAWNSRAALVLTAMAAGLLLIVVTTSGAGMVFVARHLSGPLAAAAISVLIATMVTVIALPLVLPESSQLLDARARGIPAITRRDAVLGATGLVTLVNAHVLASSYLLITVAVVLPPVIAVLRLRDAARHRLVAIVRRPLDPSLRAYLLQFANLALFWSLLSATVVTGAVDPLALP
jgi:hypothetical protein